MILIVSLILIGIVLLIVELFLLPGVTVAAIMSFGAYAGAIFLAFTNYGSNTGWLTVVVITVMSLLAAILFIANAKKWGDLSLKTNVVGVSQQQPQEKNVKVGDIATTITRLGPIGRVKIGDQTYEAKSADSYIDPKVEVEVIGFENFSIIVTKTKN